ncbi:MAG TPA: HNH endonuclease signature motif containing protein [Polyangiaceae bacterium]|nr:HNH endonuclease signature motif containing protein [Polyangiaceae bacterium]
MRTNDVRNGLLLRTDLHTLFDRHRLAINPESMTVMVDPSIEDRTYRIFEGKMLTLPDNANQQPSKDALRKHFRQCSFPSGRST